MEYIATREGDWLNKGIKMGEKKGEKRGEKRGEKKGILKSKKEVAIICCRKVYQLKLSQNIQTYQLKK